MRGERGATGLALPVLISVSISAVAGVVLLAQAGSAAAGSDLGTGEVILIGIQVIGLGAIGFIWSQFNTYRRDHAEEVARYRKDYSDDVARRDQRDHLTRSELHARLDMMIKDLHAITTENRGKITALERDLVHLAKQLDKLDETLAGVGSKATNQAERAWESRSADFQGRLTALEDLRALVLDRLRAQDERLTELATRATRLA